MRSAIASLDASSAHPDGRSELPRGVTVAQVTLNHFVMVRIHARQPSDAHATTTRPRSSLFLCAPMVRPLSALTLRGEHYETQDLDDLPQVRNFPIGSLWIRVSGQELDSLGSCPASLQKLSLKFPDPRETLEDTVGFQRTRRSPKRSLQLTGPSKRSLPPALPRIPTRFEYPSCVGEWPRPPCRRLNRNGSVASPPMHVLAIHVGLTLHGCSTRFCVASSRRLQPIPNPSLQMRIHRRRHA